MNRRGTRQVTKLIHPKLSYQVRGVLLDVHKKLGPQLKERYYQDAILIGLEEREIACTPEKQFEVFHQEREPIEEPTMHLRLPIRSILNSL
jgi:GxxExxY protein